MTTLGAGGEQNINILESSAPLQGASFRLLQRAEWPFGPKGDSGGRTDRRTDGRTDGQKDGRTTGLRELDMFVI